MDAVGQLEKVLCNTMGLPDISLGHDKIIFTDNVIMIKLKINSKLIIV